MMKYGNSCARKGPVACASEITRNTTIYFRSECHFYSIYPWLLTVIKISKTSPGLEISHSNSKTSRFSITAWTSEGVRHTNPLSHKGRYGERVVRYIRVHMREKKMLKVCLFVFSVGYITHVLHIGV